MLAFLIKLLSALGVGIFKVLRSTPPPEQRQVMSGDIDPELDASLDDSVREAIRNRDAAGSQDAPGEGRKGQS